MFNQFRVHYPQGSLVTELSAIDHGKYIVRCLVQVGGTTLVTSLAAAETVELAEDKARNRAIEILGISTTTTAESEKLPVAPQVAPLQEIPKVHSDVSVPLTPSLSASTTVSEPSEVVATPKKKPSSPVTPPSVFTELPETSESVVLQADQLKGEVNSDLTPKTPVVAESVLENTLTDAFGATTADSTTPEIPEASEVESSAEVPAGMFLPENVSTSKLDEPQVQFSSLNQAETETSSIPVSEAPVDFSEIIARTNVELKRLGWTNHQGRDYLVQTYGKRSRLELTNEELLDFLHHLEKLPNPD